MPTVYADGACRRLPLPLHVHLEGRLDAGRAGVADVERDECADTAPQSVDADLADAPHQMHEVPLALDLDPDVGGGAARVRRGDDDLDEGAAHLAGRDADPEAGRRLHAAHGPEHERLVAVALPREAD